MISRYSFAPPVNAVTSRRVSVCGKAVRIEKSDRLDFPRKGRVYQRVPDQKDTLLTDGSTLAVHDIEEVLHRGEAPKADLLPKFANDAILLGFCVPNTPARNEPSRHVAVPDHDKLAIRGEADGARSATGRPN